MVSRRLRLVSTRQLRQGLVMLCFGQVAALGWAQGTATFVTANLEETTPSLLRRVPTYGAQGGVTPAPEDISKVQLVPGTLLSMDVFGIPELSGVNLRIDEAGNVSVPLLGPLRVVGLTMAQAQQSLTQALVAAEILVNPVVHLNVIQFAPEYVAVLGEVQSPGRYQVIAPRTLADVLALAGGETAAAGTDIEVQHGAPGAGTAVQHVAYAPHESSAKLREIMIAPGDSVYVRKAGAVYVLGAVNRPGGYMMVNGGRLNIYQAISLAGGTALDAGKNGMYILRPHDEAFETIKVPFSKLAQRRPAEIELEKNDVLYVPRSGWKVTLLNGSAIIGAAVGGAVYSVR